ncbi:MAG: TetR/AcrR family transcriptional regulator [Gammaproteobacteria bacterium]|nr:MAG: TetR/AcrR family transcriptional regulator [Gammaproteobacteria bacterium]
MTKDTREKIIELAQEAIATRGYSAFSFRELATALGIKSASIHYHFPTKTHLGVEVARNYRGQLKHAFDNIENGYPDDPKKALESLIAVYRYEVRSSQRMTVCTMLGAEIKNLPVEIQTEMKSFYDLNIGFIERQFQKMGYENPREKACQLFALLQGGLMGSKGQNDPAYFDVVVKSAQLL